MNQTTVLDGISLVVLQTCMAGAYMFSNVRLQLDSDIST